MDKTIEQRWAVGEAHLAVTELNGQPVAHEHFIHDGAISEGVHRFRVFRQVAGATPGASGAEGFVVETDEWFRPVRYEAFSAVRPIREVVIADGGADVLLSDGSHLTLRLQRPDLLLQINLVMPYAVALSLAGARRAEKTFLSIDALIERPIVFLRKRVLRGWNIRWVLESGSSFDLGPDGHVAAFRTPEAMTSGRVEPAPFPDVDLEALRVPRHLPYHPPTGIELRDVSIPAGDVEIGAAFALPLRRDGPLPAALLLQGSGQHDRHGIAAEHDTGVHEVADYLASRGLATLRYDSRGIGGTRFGTKLSAWDALLGDARAALKWLRTRPEVAPDRLFIIGQSLGAIVALAIAHDDPSLRGLALLASPGRPLGQVIIDQSAREARQLGLGRIGERARHQTLTELLRAVEEEPIESPMPLSDQRLVLQVDPAELIDGVDAPLLFCNGGRDLRIDLFDDALHLAKTAAARGRAELRIFPGLDHLFRGTSGPQIDGPFLESLLWWTRSCL